MAWEEDFLYPLYLLLIGAGVSGGAVALLTHFLEGHRKKRDNELENRRQKQQNDLEDLRKEREMEVERKRKELEIKVDIASKMAELTGYVVGEAAGIAWKGKNTINDADYVAHSEILKKLAVDYLIIKSKLETYFSGTEIRERWISYYILLGSYYIATSRYFLKDIKDDPNLEYHLRRIRNYFKNNKELEWHRLTPDKPYDPDLWSSVAEIVGKQGEEITKELLKLSIKVF